MTDDNVNESASTSSPVEPPEMTPPAVPHTAQSWLLTVIALVPLLLAVAVGVGVDECTLVEPQYLVIAGLFAIVAIVLAWTRGSQRDERRSLLLSLGCTALAWLFLIRQVINATYAVGCDLSAL